MKCGSRIDDLGGACYLSIPLGSGAVTISKAVSHPPNRGNSTSVVWLFGCASSRRRRAASVEQVAGPRALRVACSNRNAPARGWEAAMIQYAILLIVPVQSLVHRLRLVALFLPLVDRAKGGALEA